MRAVLAILLLSLLTTPSSGCKNSMRIAQSMVEAEGIGRDVRAMERAADEMADDGN